jgi:hypothetical protein
MLRRVVYAAGAVQGRVLVAFPAAGTIFTDPDRYDLSNTEYGVLFLPQVATAIAAFGVGPILDSGVKLSTIYGVSAVIAVAMGVASFGVTRART